MSNLPLYMTTDEVADLLRTRPETVRGWRHVSKGPKWFHAGRRVLYCRADVEEWIEYARAHPASYLR